MEETQKIFEPTQVTRDETVVHEPDATLVTPRFDEVEAQVARPVVPLAGRPARIGKSGGGRRQWPIALVLISALAGGVVSLLAFRLYQQRQQTQAVVTETGGQQTPTAADASQSPEQAGAAGATVATTEEQAQSGAPVVFEEFDPAKEGGAISDAAPVRPKATTEAVAAPARRDEAKEETREEAKPAPRAAEPKPRLVETIRPPRQVEARHEDARRSDDYRAEDEDFGDRRRERRRQRREQRREQRRNIDRIKDIFEGAPPS
ncbi:MAG TPA: hypothetical protein VGX24_03650 [Pyrinomonadaceae bacterium]|jgi:hypothetical protein|nr:hypothetical protein [Pyrinomonadaceae bacterium]